MDAKLQVLEVPTPQMNSMSAQLSPFIHNSWSLCVHRPRRPSPVESIPRSGSSSSKQKDLQSQSTLRNFPDMLDRTKRPMPGSECPDDTGIIKWRSHQDWKREDNLTRWSQEAGQ